MTGPAGEARKFGLVKIAAASTPGRGFELPRQTVRKNIIVIDETLRGRTRYGLTVQLMAIVALSATVFEAMTPGQVVAGGAVTKLLFLGRMGLLLLVATIFLHLRGLGWTDLGLRRPRPWRWVVSVAGGLVASMVLVPLVRQAVFRLGGAAADYSMFARLQGNLTEYLYWALPVTIGSAAFGEELLFRGFVLDALLRLFRSRSALAASGTIVLQASVFGLLHLYQGWGGVATAGTTGLVLGFVWLASGRNLWAGIVTHGLLDLASVTVIFLSGLPKAN